MFPVHLRAKGGTRTWSRIHGRPAAGVFRVHNFVGLEAQVAPAWVSTAVWPSRRWAPPGSRTRLRGLAGCRARGLGLGRVSLLGRFDLPFGREYEWRDLAAENGYYGGAGSTAYMNAATTTSVARDPGSGVHPPRGSCSDQYARLEGERWAACPAKARTPRVGGKFQALNSKIRRFAYNTPYWRKAS